MKISVIMPTYNDCKSIEETLDSLKNQTYKNWELVIVDDGSIDDTKKVINRYIENNNLNKKIKYIYQENGDQLNAILNGMNYLSGDYIYLLHSDDLLASYSGCFSIHFTHFSKTSLDANKSSECNKYI